MGVKSAKTFEEIVERLAALFKLNPRPGERDYEASVEAVPTSHDPLAAQKATNNKKNQKR
jgi:hypothetical protein